MDSRTFCVQQIFQDRRQYRVPFYQRPYVWNRDDQWGRLWEDIRDKAETRLQGGKAYPHFMGAVVLEPQKKVGLLGVERHHIIDGQQRLTTLQYVLTALVHTLRVSDAAQFLPLVEACLSNANPETMEDKVVERFKLWPTFRDRKQYELAMTAGSIEDLRARFPLSFTQTGNLRKIGIDHPPALEAIVYFHEQMIDWIREVDGGSALERATALATSVLQDLSIVCISLGEDDDAQIIFETLNGHGAELHATDLIRNFIFMRAGTNADELYSSVWSQFEAPIWSEAQSRGRLNRPRMEWFVQTAVQAQTGEEIDIGRLYAGYRRFVDAAPGLRAADDQLSMLNKYGEHYIALVTGVGDSPIAAFGRRVAPWDASPTHALALRVAASDLDVAEQVRIFGFVESYLVRRAICGLSRKNYNKVFAQQLKRLMDSGMTAENFKQSLTSLTGEASRWPGDDEFRANWLKGPMYPGRLDAAKLRALFLLIETELRSVKTEEPVPLALNDMDIDHILPQSWFEYWPLGDGSHATYEDAITSESRRFLGETDDTRAAAILARQDAVPRIGNLTMIHYGVNRSLQNHDFDAKRRAFFEHSNLQLNRALMTLQDWTEARIEERGVTLFAAAQKLWPGPSAV